MIPMNPVIVIIQFDKKFKSIIAIRMFRLCFRSDLALRICSEWPSFLFTLKGHPEFCMHGGHSVSTLTTDDFDHHTMCTAAMI